jgi:hypothetical protein
MILTAHQPAYMPWLGYFHKIALADNFVMLDDVQFEKNSFTNRNKIKTSNGEAWLTIPVEMKGHLDKKISDIQMESRSNWKRKHWNSLLMNYKKAPFFDQYAGYFEKYYTLETNNLFDFISVSSDFFFNELNIKPVTKKLSELQIDAKKQDLILDMCRATGSNAFVFGALGKNYADKNLFATNGISIYFQEFEHPVYPQLWGDFVPYMGVIDALFNLGSQRTSEIIFEKNITKKELAVILKSAQ